MSRSKQGMEWRDSVTHENIRKVCTIFFQSIIDTATHTNFHFSTGELHESLTAGFETAKKLLENDMFIQEAGGYVGPLITILDLLNFHFMYLGLSKTTYRSLEKY